MKDNSKDNGQGTSGFIDGDEGSPFLRLSLVHHDGTRIEIPTKLTNTPEGRATAGDFLDSYRRMIEREVSWHTIPKRKPAGPSVLRFDEWTRVIEAMNPFYRPMAELMIKTGLLGSAVANLQEKHIRDGILHVEGGRSEYRRLCVPITEAIARDLSVLRARMEPDGYLFAMANGQRFGVDTFRKSVWKPAFTRAGVPHRTPYVLRRTFAAWALMIGVHPQRVARLMGHADARMVHEDRGRYFHGVPWDGRILQYFGRDFLGIDVDGDAGFGE